MNEPERLDLFDYLTGAVLVAVVLFATLPHGSVAPWAKSLIYALALVTAALWWFQCAARGRIRIVRGAVWLFLPLALLLAGIHLLPLAPGLIRLLSPAAAGLYDQALPGWAGGTRTLSLDPHATKATLVHWTALALILVVVMNTVRTRSQVKVLVAALASVGAFQVLYGFFEHFSGHNHIFWNARQYHLSAVTGTFHNKNHFAGLLIMIVPVVLGLFIALSPRPVRTPSRRVRLVNTFSAAATHRQIVLGAALVLMVLGIFFSLSRAGILCAFLSWAGFAIVLTLASGFRRYTLVLLFLTALTLCFAAGIGVELVIDGLEEAASGRSTSWEDRLDLWRSGLVMAGTFPVLGTGPGTFAAAFERFQSIRFGDRSADFLHNDWLQVFCELGVAGGVLLCLGTVLVFLELFKRTLSRRDRFCRWTGIGAMMGSSAMLLHSLFDYNLYKITSNGVVFAVILGLWHAAAALPHRGGRSAGGDSPGGVSRRRHLEIPIPSRAVGFGGAALLVAVMGWIAAGSLSAGFSDLHYNRYLACPEIRGRPDDYHFLKAEPKEIARAGEEIRAALRLDPSNPTYHYYAAVGEVKKAEKFLAEKARETALIIVGEKIKTSDPASFQRIVENMTRSLQPVMALECGPALARAEAHLRRAILLAPGVSGFHIRLAGVMALRARGAGGPDAAREALREARLAVQLAPNKPSVLFDAGQIFIDQGLIPDKGNPLAEEGLRFAEACFRRTLIADPDYAGRIYAVARCIPGCGEDLAEVTPKTVPGYEKLIGTLWDLGRWAEALSCLNTSMAMLGEGLLESPSEEALPGMGTRRFDLMDRGETLRNLSRKRCTVLGILGQWSDRAIEVSRYSDLMQRHVEGLIREARSLRENGRYHEAFSLCLELLERDWRNVELRIETADLASLPRVVEGAPTWNRTLDHLFRLVINSNALEADELEEALVILDSLRLEEGEDLLAAELIRGAGCVLAGRFDEGVGTLELLAGKVEELGAAWPQRHLVWYFLGRAHEMREERSQALAAYRRVAEEVPTHLESLERIHHLDGKEGGSGERIRALTPEISCRVSFGGKVELLGLSLASEKGPGSGEAETWYLTYYWRFLDRMYEGYHPVVHFLDENWRTLFQDDHRTRILERPYPVDLPRSGEVVVDRRRLSSDPNAARYIRIGFVTAATAQPGSRHLLCDGGDRFFLTSCEVLKKEGR